MEDGEGIHDTEMGRREREEEGQINGHMEREKRMMVRRVKETRSIRNVLKRK